MHRRAFQRYRALGCFTPEIEAQYLAWMDSPAGRKFYFHFFAHYHVPVRPELAAGLPDIHCPTAVIFGPRDPYVPFQTARELAARIPNATLSVIPDADHFVMEERPTEVTATLEQLLARPILTR